jgi:membrane fusion protein, copper/silver efflux system
MRNFILGFILALVIAAGAFWVITSDPFGGGTAGNEPQQYHCPMHPTYVADRPGSCPICGMDLVPIREDGEVEDYEWHDYDEHAGHDMDSEAEEAQAGGEVPGYSTVRITPERQQLMGIRLAEAVTLPLEQSVRTVGRVVYDETRLHHVHTKFEGYIEKLYADFVGQLVRKGEPLFSIYSPELYATQKEYLLALRARDQFGDLSTPKTGPRIDLIGSARQRLALWDISEAQIKRLEETREPIRALTIASPATGIVAAKTAVEGLRVMPGDTLFDLIDLSSVWVLADIYEANLPMIRLGQRAEVTLAYEPGRKYSGRITFIDPTMNESTRTVQARIEVPNPGGTLKPQMFGNVLIQSSRGTGVAVPDDAVISTGERDLVFVARGKGTFEPREITLGIRMGDLYEIKSGLSAGERVVTGANFLLDSESKLRASIAGAPAAGHQHGE